MDNTKRSIADGRFVKYEGPRWEVDELTGCWNWLLCKNDKGYGWAWNPHKKKAEAVYVTNYELSFGKIAPGLELDHLCRNRGCVNPFHLEAVLSKINTRRGKKAKLTQEQVDQIRNEFTGQYGEGVGLMKKFGIGRTQLTRILTHQRWV